MIFLLTKEKLTSVILMFFISLLTLYLYNVQIQLTNEYMGMQPLKSSFYYIITSLFLLDILFIIFPKRSLNPSSIFLGIYIVFCLFWITFLHGVSGLVDLEGLFILFMFLAFPVIFLRVGVPYARQIFRKVDLTTFYAKNIFSTEWLMVLFLIFVFMVISQQLSFSFSFDDSYVRRLHAREVIDGLLAYLIPSGLNGVAPFLAFIGMYKKKYYFFILALVFTVSVFGFLGTKAPILFVLLMGIMGFNLRNRICSVVNLFLWFILSVCVVSTLEYSLFGFSWISEILIRRAFIVVPQNQGYFLHYLLNNSTLFDFIFGQPQGSSITFLIGEAYYNNPNTNANTNAFLYEIGRNGILGYLFSILLITIFMAFLDILYEKYEMFEAIGVSIIYSLLVVEQSYSTAMITSGILLITLFTILNVKKKVSCNDYS